MRERRNHLLLVALIAAALVGVALLAVPGSPVHRKAVLGLDLQGGLEVVLKAIPPKGKELTQGDLDRSVDIMRNRIDKLGVSEPEVRKQDKDQIVIQLAGVTDPKNAAALIGKTAQLELFDLEQDLTGPSIGSQGAQATLSIHDLLAGQQGGGKFAEYYLVDKAKKVLEGPVDSKGKLFTRKHPKVPKGGMVLGVPEGTVVVSCTVSTELDSRGFPKQPCPGNVQPGQTAFYLFKHQPDDAENPIPEMTGADLKGSGTRQDFDAQTGLPIVRMAFTGKGGGKFQDITRRLYQRGNLRGVPQHFAIVLDREIKSFPQIDPNDSQLSNGISGGAQIEGIGSAGEAKDLALVLQTGALPVSFEQIERTDVSATLGRDSLREAKTAALIGMLLVAIFLIVLYRLLGLVAVLGLAIYAAFMYAAILLFNVTLTLPGFAGLILTIGVAADANVVIFERIKEEVRAGKSARAAIATGYQKGFHTIVDANVVTAITALVLFAVASAQVKGFALMLLIGTVVSLVTAVAATRAMLGLLAGFRWFDNASFMGAAGEQRGRFLQIDFMGKRRTWFAISGTIVAISIAAIALRGLNLGIDFKGGTQVAFKTQNFVPLDRVRREACAIGHCDAIVQGRGSSQGEKYKSFQIRTRSLSLAQQNRLQTTLTEDLNATSVGVKSVSSSFSRQIAKYALIAIFVSLALIVLYIALRFDLKYALPVLVALAHDIIITVGIYAFTGREVTTATVAAVLTVLGYSIYDTIIIFDRIRENVPLMRRASFATIANISLWETIRRSLATTFITLLPVASLYLFGGATLKDFAFALLVGIGSGAYSSIFVAAPLLSILKEREPEYARRVGSEVVEHGVGGVLGAEETKEQELEPALVGEQPPAAPAPAPTPAGGDCSAPRPQTKREERRQRRRTRPHGRSR